MSSSEIISRIWSGSIPVVFKLDSSISKDGDSGLEYHTVLRRNSYIHFELFSILNFFGSSGAVGGIGGVELLDVTKFWFAVDGVPLKWNWPVGLLYDITTIGIERSSGVGSGSITILGSQYTAAANDDDNDNGLGDLVWKVAVKYDDYPIDYIIPIELPVEDKSKSSDFVIESFLKNYWINQLKETCFILNGSSNKFLSFSNSQTIKFYKNITKTNDDNVESFDDYFNKIVPSNISHLKNLPIKIYLPLLNRIIQPTSTVLQSKGKIDRSLTLGDLLQLLIPDLFPSNLMFTVAYPICHGIILPLKSPIIDLYFLLKYLDGFLHISIKMISKNAASN